MSTFGVPRFDPALFYGFPFALRFELGGEDGDLPDRLKRAGARALIVADALFGRTPRFHALLTTYVPPSASMAQQRHLDLTLARALRVHGIGQMPGPAETIWHWDWDEEPENQWLVRYSVLRLRPGSECLGRLLHLSIHTDYPSLQPMGWPRFGMKVHLIDLRRRLVLHVYDDRGMDVIAMDRATLLRTYHRFRAWLLPYDRDRMDATFGPA